MHKILTQSLIYLNDYRRLMARHAKTIHSPEEQKFSAENLMEIQANIDSLKAAIALLTPRPGEIKQEVAPAFKDGFYVSQQDMMKDY